MPGKAKRRVYVPPRVIDLSASSVDGQDPLGTCSNGTYPYSGCNSGQIVGVSDCTVGNQVDDYPQCRSGSWAHSACLSGGQAG